MCREDLKLGRQKFTSVKTVDVPDATPVPLFGEAKNRTHIFIAAARSDGIVAPNPVTPTGTAGIGVPIAGPPLDFDIETHGNVVTMPWVASAPNAATTFTVIETFFTDGKYP